MKELHMARILVVDDDALFRETLLTSLEGAGHELSAAANGVECLRLLEQQQADLVIMDILMPEKEGIETIIELRKRFPELRIIAMSGGGAPGKVNMLEAAKKLGANLGLAKPFRLAALTKSIEEVLQEKSPGA